MSKPSITLERVSMHYDNADSPVLNGVDLTVNQGESIAIVGPSGCGKSTLLNLIGTLDRPTDGSITLNGQSIAGLNDKQLAALRNQQIGFIFQDHHLLPQCTALENVLVPTLINKSTDATDRARALLDRVGLADKYDSRPGQLSGGQRQRIAVVRALINQPTLLLADEPTGSLDSAASDDMADLLTELNREDGLTLIVVTHADNVAARMERVIELRDGKLNETAAAS